jgi:DNA processing protein
MGEGLASPDFAPPEPKPPHIGIGAGDVQSAGRLLGRRERRAVVVSETERAAAGIEDDAAYWLAVSRVPYIGPARIERLVQRFGTLQAAWTAPRDELRTVLEAKPLAELVAARARVDPHQERERIEAQGIAVTYPGHPAYPRLLAEAAGRPSILYMRGALTPAGETGVAIVGTRRSTPYGRQAAERIATELAQAGVTVISGLARGVDGVAHRAALAAGGRTIAVLGSGADVIYPGEHRRLAEEIIGAGAIVSEHPPGTPPDAQNFPARNRIISGMSLGVVVIEAPLRSGALITATFAADQGREVFVVPGSVFSPASAGTNLLLRDGARIVRDGADVLEDLNLDSHRAASTLQTALPLDGNERKMYDTVGSEARHIDELAEAAGLAARDAAALLLTMELKGLVRNHGAQYYVRR